MVRNIEAADPWTVLFYRSLAFFVTVLIFMIVCDGGRLSLTARRVRRLGWLDLLIASALASGFIFYLQSLFATTVANTVLMLSTGPFFAALLGWVFLREKISLVTWVTMCMAFAGIAIMLMGAGLRTDSGASDLLGIVFAVAAVLAFAIMVVSLRWAGPERDMLMATSLAGLIAAVVSGFMMPTFQISLHDLLLSIGLGSIQIGIGFIFITLASRTVPAAQVPLLALGETALAPLWVWLFVNEVPAINTLIGGVIVLSAVIWQGYAGIRQRDS